jgi:hypothetical protein
MCHASPFISASDPLLQAERRSKAWLSESNQVGFVPLPRAGGALWNAVFSIRNYQSHCQTEVRWIGFMRDDIRFPLESPAGKPHPSTYFCDSIKG